MKSARTLQTTAAGCPQCRARLLAHFFPLLPRPAGRPTFTKTSRVIAVRQVRALFTTRLAFEKQMRPQDELGKEHSEAKDTEPTTEEEQPKFSEEQKRELLVRQTRQTFGDTLPPGYLSTEEYRLYERLYGSPLRETRPEDVGILNLTRDGAGTPRVEGTIHGNENANVLLKQSGEGCYEEVDYHIKKHEVQPQEEAEGVNPEGSAAEEQDCQSSNDVLEKGIDERFEYFNATANNEREYDALVKLQKDFEAAALRAYEEKWKVEQEKKVRSEEEEDAEEDAEEDEEDQTEEPEMAVQRDDSLERMHRHTVMGKFKTFPTTLHLPKQKLVRPIQTLLGRTDPAHIKMAAEKLLGGADLPYSPATPPHKRNLPQKSIPIEPGHHRMSAIDADVYLAAVMPGVYATAMSALVEVRKRLGSSWIRQMLQTSHGPRVLDVGGGGASLVAWQAVLEAEWKALQESGELPERKGGPPGKRTVVIGSDHLRQRISKFLDSTTFLPRLPDYLHTMSSEPQLDAGDAPQHRKRYDVIVLAHALMPLDKPYKRRDIIDNVWQMLSPAGGILIVLEKGHPRGFEAVADVRQRILDEFIVPPPGTAPGTDHFAEDEIQGGHDGEGRKRRVREPGMIVAPCTNHAKCPMYQNAGLTPGRKDFCHFSQRFIRPAFLQRVTGSSHRNHEDINFSFVAVRRGDHEAVAPPDTKLQQGDAATDAAFTGFESATELHPLSLPRNILPPLKRHGHVTMDLCTPSGTLERWTIPKSFSKQAYHDARKTKWGDLWALGAKTRVRRGARTGDPTTVIAPGRKFKTKREEREFVLNANKKRVVEIDMDTQRVREKVPKRLSRQEEGRRVRIEELLEEVAEGARDEDDEEMDRDLRRLAKLMGGLDKMEKELEKREEVKK